MKSDEMIDTVWMRLGQEKYLMWEVKIVLLLATFVSYFTMPFVVTLLIASASALMMLTLRKAEPSKPGDEKV